MRVRESELSSASVTFRDKALPCGIEAHCVSFSFDFPLDGVQISRQRPVQSGVLSNYKHFVLQNALLMSGKRVPRASLIRSNVRSLNFPSLSHTRSPSFSFVQSVTQSHYQLVSCSQIEHFSNTNNNNYTTFGLVTSIFLSQLHKLSCTFFAYIIQFFLLSLSHYAIKLVNVPQTQFR